MYQIGDLIIYENSGVCEVSDVTTPADCSALSGMPKDRTYYILHPVFGKGTIYTPADSDKAFMRPVISKDEAIRLIGLIPTMRTDAYYAQNLQDLKTHYRTATGSHRCEDLMAVTMSVYHKKQHAKARGKRVGQVDEKYMQQAEELLFGELAVALGISRSEVPGYIKRALEESGAV